VKELFEGYRDGAGSAYDEMFDGDAMRGPYESIAASLEQVSGPEVRARADALTLYLEQGVTFDIGGEERAFPLDIMPRVIGQDAWTAWCRGRWSPPPRTTTGWRPECRARTACGSTSPAST
jgi:uncharacterized circularly permuted ATP-grasp superfamily protein